MNNGSNNGGNNSANNSNDSGVGQWGANKGLSPYDDFGTPISGLSFQPVYFRFDQSAIATSEYAKLDKIVSYLSANPGTGVVIEGHCDTKGSDEYNRGLGERRALAAKDYLVNKGVAENRIRTVSYGEEKPAGNDDSLNRRDEFIGVTLKQ
ncbi:MAG: OmpA family protein [Lentisphaeria bacterium]|nr:OmpA family protein [Lentisphaeria bacterium]